MASPQPSFDEEAHAAAPDPVRDDPPPAHRPSLRGWLSAHSRALVGTLGLLWQAPFATALTAATIGIALALPLGLYLVVDGMGTLTARWDRSAELSVFMTPQTDEARAERVGAQFGKLDEVLSVRTLGRAEVLREFEAITGLEGLSESFRVDNPLPAVLVIHARGKLSDPAARPRLLGLAAELEAHPAVDSVEFDTQWVARLGALLSVVNRASAVLATLLGIGLLLIVGNVIRVMVERRREEVEVAKLFGATDAFVRRPFLYTGLILGIAGALAAWIVLLLAESAIAEPINLLLALYPGASGWPGVGIGALAGLVLAGGGIGWVGAWLAATRVLRGFTP